MRKELISCDSCGVLLDYETSSEGNCEFYNISREWIRGWSAIDRSFGADSTFQICKKCLGKLELKPTTP